LTFDPPQTELGRTSLRRETPSKEERATSSIGERRRLVRSRDEIAQSGVHVEKSLVSVGTKAVPAFGGIEWHIEKSTTGKEISMFSLRQSESEILGPPGSRFRFVKGKIADPKGGQPIEFSNHAALAMHMPLETKAGVFAFEQVG
jgi:hypothetical protein